VDTDHLYVIIVMPEGGSTGQNLIDVINSLALAARLPAVIVADVDCGGNRMWAEEPPFASTAHEVLNYARSVDQFDWATFFFFPEGEQPPAPDYQFESLFAKALVTVRAVDGTYFYVYSWSADDVSRLSGRFRVEFSRKPHHEIVHPF
jgi:hypothetical protein